MRADLTDDLQRYLTADEFKVINEIKNAGYTILGRIEELASLTLHPDYELVKVGEELPPGAQVWYRGVWVEENNYGLIGSTVGPYWSVRRIKRGTPENSISHPPHYGGKDDPFEVIKIIEAKKLGFHEGNVLKYLLRATHKGNEIEDLEKAAWYLNRLINLRKSAKGSER